MFGNNRGEWTRYKMQQRLIALGEDFTITDEQGAPAFTVDGKVLRIRETFVIADRQGREVATIRQKLLALRDSMTIERGGATIATIRRAWIAPLRDKFNVDVAGGGDLVAQGNILDHEYEIRRGGDPVAQISKQWFTIRDTYGIAIAPGEDHGLILAIAVAIDELAHDPDERQE